MAGEEVIEAVALVSAEGELSENWRDALDDDIKDAACLKEVGDFKQLAKDYVHAQKMVGKDKVPLPGEAADDDEWSAFFSQVGKPKTFQDYPYTRPEGVPEEDRTEDKLNAAREKAFAMNWTQWQWKQYMKSEDARALDNIETQKAADELEAKKGHEALDKVWGMKKEDRLNAVSNFLDEHIKEAMGEDFVRGVLDKYGRDPMFYRLLWPMVKETLEGEQLIAELSQKAPKEAQAELEELMASEAYQKWMTGELSRVNPSKAYAMEQKYLELHQIIHPEKEAGSQV
jgi:hypothetical protein